MGELTREQPGGVLNRWTQAQTAVIGAMMIDERCLGEVFQATSAEMFSDSTLRHIYEAARRLWLEHRPVDPVTVADACGGAGKAYVETISEAMRLTPTANNVLAYAEICRESLLMSRYREAAYSLLDAATADECMEIWNGLGKELMNAKKVRRVTLMEAIGRYLDRMDDPAPPDYLSLGIKRLDELLHVGRGKFVILAADSSAGKTALALQFAYHLADTGKKVGFFSLETDNDTLTDRLMAETQVAGIALPRTKAKALSSVDYKKAIDAGDRSARVNLRLIDSVETVDGIRAETIARGFDVIFIDYLQLIDEAGEKRWDTVTQISMRLHRMAQTLGVTVFGLSQVTPPDKSGQKHLTMDDLRESRQLKHDADVILIMELCDEFTNGRSLTIAKNKDGRRNRGMKLDFDPEHMTFSYHKRVPTSDDPKPPQFEELDDDEGGPLPF
jgi:replicative DNA helicase